ncbi:MAG: cytochrome c [Pseudomonadota bacterium]|nr:cytochrome c [Pseudomonadota bacterium]
MSCSHRAIRTAFVMVSICACAAALAQAPAPFARGEPPQGKILAERDCVACHARRFDGDGDRMYLRPDHRVRTAQQLLAQVSYCNAQLGTQYFPDDEEHVAAYLNERYYHFKP